VSSPRVSHLWEEGRNRCTAAEAWFHIRERELLGYNNTRLQTVEAVKEESRLKIDRKLKTLHTRNNMN
jgi:hypothetical protein